MIISAGKFSELSYFYLFSSKSAFNSEAQDKLIAAIKLPPWKLNRKKKCE